MNDVTSYDFPIFKLSVNKSNYIIMKVKYRHDFLVMGIIHNRLKICRHTLIWF